MRPSLSVVALAWAEIACGPDSGPAAHRDPVQQSHSSSMVASADGARLFVAHPDADAVSILDVSTRSLVHERVLAAAPPVVGADGRYEPAVAPRALALDSAGSTLYVTGERSGHLYALDASSAKVRAEAFVCSEPVGVLVAADGRSVFVACSGDDEIVEVAAKTLAPVARVPCPRKPWALAWGADGVTLLVTHLLGPGVSRFTTDPLVFEETFSLAPGPAHVVNGEADPRFPHGPVRGIYDAAVRPGTSELWVASLMLGIDTPQPKLDFERTVFPALPVLDGEGQEIARLSVVPEQTEDGAFGDVVSGPHALAFSEDGKLVFVADANSEDVLVIDAEQRAETTLVRPLSGHLPEALVVTNGTLYVQQRNTEDVAAFRIERDQGGRRGGPEDSVSVVPDGRAFRSLSKDPMPAELRLGQKLFYSANSDDVPVTRNHWVACASCHLEGRSDAVTWRFEQGPRDTPSNAGGLLDTGFLFRTADRTRVEDYFRTIEVEQGGHFDGVDPAQEPFLRALAAFVNRALAAPSPPSTDATHAITGAALGELRARGEAIFEQAGCAVCHSGPAKTDSGAGNAALDLAGPEAAEPTPGGVLLHDVGTCVMGPGGDVDHEDMDGHARGACAFDTPQLRGLWDSAPYLHDGSAATLDDVLQVMLRAVRDPAAAAALSSDDRSALVEYLRGL